MKVYMIINGAVIPVEYTTKAQKLTLAQRIRKYLDDKMPAPDLSKAKIQEE